jgi:hypothetical protein
VDRLLADRDLSFALVAGVLASSSLERVGSGCTPLILLDLLLVLPRSGVFTDSILPAASGEEIRDIGGHSSASIPLAASAATFLLADVFATLILAVSSAALLLDEPTLALFEDLRGFLVSASSSLLSRFMSGCGGFPAPRFLSNGVDILGMWIGLNWKFSGANEPTEPCELKLLIEDVELAGCTRTDGATLRLAVALATEALVAAPLAGRVGGETPLTKCEDDVGPLAGFASRVEFIVLVLFWITV